MFDFGSVFLHGIICYLWICVFWRCSRTVRRMTSRNGLMCWEGANNRFQKTQPAGTGLMSFSWQAGGRKIRIQWMMQLQDDIDKSNPSNPNPCRFARKMWCGPPDGFRHLCSPIWTSMIQWFTHTKHQLVYFLNLWWTYSSTLPSERILPMLLRTLEKARKNKMGVACFGGYGVVSQETWRLLFKSLSFSKSRIHSVNCLEPDYVHLLSKSTETLASRLLITLDTHLLVAETIPAKPPWDRTSPPIEPPARWRR